LIPFSGGAFAQYIDDLFPRILNLYKPTSSVSERSTAMAAFAIIIEGMVCRVLIEYSIKIGFKESASQVFGLHLMPLLLQAHHDENEEVRSNAAFATGGQCYFPSSLPTVCRTPLSVCWQ
jgi:hypothetical protein